MTSKSHALGASISWRPDALFCCGLAVACLILLPGCSFAPDDAVAATNSADSPARVEAGAVVEAPSIDATQNSSDKALAENKSASPDNSTDSGDAGERIASDEDSIRTHEVTIKQTVSSPTTTNAVDDAPKKIDSSKTLDLTFDDLAFEMEKTEKFKRSMLTPKINSFNGRSIRLRGFILPAFQQSGITQFVFVRDNKECCFGPGAALYDCVLVRLAKGKKTVYTVRPITIEGKFQLKEEPGPDGKIWSIYRMKNAIVR
jgi:hypothetical protein